MNALVTKFIARTSARPALLAASRSLSPQGADTRSYTVIVERVQPVGLARVGRDPRKLPLRPNNMHYKFVDCLHSRKWGNIDLILTDFVEGIGRKGELVNVSRHLAYYELLPSGLAVYPTDEYLELYAKDREGLEKKARVSPYAFKAKEKMSQMILEIPMNLQAKWTLNRDHVRIAMRYNKIFAPNENLTMPEGLVITNESAGKLKEPFVVKVKIDDYTVANLRCVIKPIEVGKLWESYAMFQKTV